MLGQVDQQTLFINMMLLVSLLVLGVIGLILLIAAWTGVKIGLWHFRRKRAERDEQSRKQAPGGASGLPVGRGLCSRCGTVSDPVYHLPSGERCCPACYRQFFEG
jgi:hypothetical protein